MPQVNLKTDAPKPAPGRSLNGDAGALAVDRAIGELRRGRAIALAGTGGALVFAVVETIGGALYERLRRASPRARLVLTAERARAAGLNPDEGPVTLDLARGVSLTSLRALAGLSGARMGGTRTGFELWRGDDALVLAAFGLAKAARLVPALLGFPVASVKDDSLHTVSLAAVLEHATATRAGIQLISESRVPLAACERSRVALYRDEHGGGEHVAVIVGEPDLSASVPVRLHSACLTGDLLGSLRCDCGEQLSAAIERIAALGGGILLYLDQEGRSIGLANKLRAYQIQDTGVDTYDADRYLGFSADERSYDVAASMLRRIGATRVRLLTNNPRKIHALRGHGIDVVDRLPLVTRPNVHNEDYLRTKRERAGHLGHGIEDSPKEGN